MATGLINSGGPSWTLTAGDNGKLIGLGDLPDQFQSGGFTLDFLPDAAWVTATASIAIQARSCTPEAATADTAFMAWPYRIVGGGTGTVTAGATTLTARQLIWIPGSGVTVAFLVACTGGTAQVFVRGWTGAPAL